MVDYSKWNRFQDSDNDTSEETTTRPFPRVTKLDKPGRFTIDSSGTTFEESHNSNIPVATSSSSCVNDLEVPDDWIRNGSRSNNTIWSQTPADIIIHHEIPSHLKAKDIKDIKYNSVTREFKFETTCNDVQLEGILRFEILINDIKDDSNFIVDWEIVSLSNKSSVRRFLEIILKKKLPMTNIVVWWDRLFSNDTPIDLTKIEGKRSNLTNTLWEDAHKQFKEKISKRQHKELI